MSSTTSSQSPLRTWLVEIFAFGNLAFLAIDIYLAHRVNDFAHPAEWIPIYFSAIVPLLLLPGILKRRHNDRLSRKTGLPSVCRPSLSVWPDYCCTSTETSSTLRLLRYSFTPHHSLPR